MDFTKIALFAFFFILVLSPNVFAIDCGPNPNDLCKFVEDTSTRWGTSVDTIVGGVANNRPASMQCQAPGIPTGQGNQPAQDPSSFLLTSNAVWMVNAGYVMIISVFIFILVHFLGIVLQQQNLITRAKQEYYEAGMTALRLAFLIVVMVGVEQFYSINRQGSTDPVYSVSDSYIDASINFSVHLIKDMTNNFSLLLIYNMIIHTLYSATLWFGVTWRAMFSFNLGPALRPIIDIIGFSMQFLSVGIGEWMVHFGMLCLIKRWTWAIFIPIAMIMRSIWFLRSAGDGLIALMVAFAIIYPVMFVIDYEVYKLMGGSVFGTTVQGLGGTYDNNSPFVTFIQQFGVSGVSGIFLAIGLLMGGFFIPFFLTGALTVAFELIRTSVFFIVIMSIVLPFINIFVTLTSAKETARYFNAEINFMGFVKLI